MRVICVLCESDGVPAVWDKDQQQVLDFMQTGKELATLLFHFIKSDYDSSSLVEYKDSENDLVLLENEDSYEAAVNDIQNSSSDILTLFIHGSYSVHHNSRLSQSDNKQEETHYDDSHMESRDSENSVDTVGSMSISSLLELIRSEIRKELQRNGITSENYSVADEFNRTRSNSELTQLSFREVSPLRVETDEFTCSSSSSGSSMPTVDPSQDDDILSWGTPLKITPIGPTKENDFDNSIPYPETIYCDPNPSVKVVADHNFPGLGKIVRLRNLKPCDIIRHGDKEAIMLSLGPSIMLLEKVDEAAASNSSEPKEEWDYLSLKSALREAGYELKSSEAEDDAAIENQYCSFGEGSDLLDLSLGPSLEASVANIVEHSIVPAPIVHYSGPNFAAISAKQTHGQEPGSSDPFDVIPVNTLERVYNITLANNSDRSPSFSTQALFGYYCLDASCSRDPLTIEEFEKHPLTHPVVRLPFGTSLQSLGISLIGATELALSSEGYCSVGFLDLNAEVLDDGDAILECVVDDQTGAYMKTWKLLNSGTVEWKNVQVDLIASSEGVKIAGCSLPQLNSVEVGKSMDLTLSVNLPLDNVSRFAKLSLMMTLENTYVKQYFGPPLVFEKASCEDCPNVVEGQKLMRVPSSSSRDSDFEIIEPANVENF